MYTHEIKKKMNFSIPQDSIGSKIIQRYQRYTDLVRIIQQRPEAKKEL